MSKAEGVAQAPPIAKYILYTTQQLFQNHLAHAAIRTARLVLHIRGVKSFGFVTRFGQMSAEDANAPHCLGHCSPCPKSEAVSDDHAYSQYRLIQDWQHELSQSCT